MVKQEPPKLLDEGSNPFALAKICSTCKELEIIKEFSKNKSKTNGYSYILCANCHREFHYLKSMEK